MKVHICTHCGPTFIFARDKLTTGLKNDLGPFTRARPLTTCQNHVQFHSGRLGIATNKMADVRLVSAAVIVAIICKRRTKKRIVKSVWERVCRLFKSTSSLLPSDIFLSVSSSKKGSFRFCTGGRFPIMTTEATSSATLTQENLTFLPYSVEICEKYVVFCRFRLRLSQRFKLAYLQ